MVIVELKEMETSSGIYEEEDNIQIDFGEGTEASTEIFPLFIETTTASVPLSSIESNTVSILADSNSLIVSF